jgi:hypothetical protein
MNADEPRSVADRGPAAANAPKWMRIDIRLMWTRARTTRIDVRLTRIDARLDLILARLARIAAQRKRIDSRLQRIGAGLQLIDVWTR